MEILRRWLAIAVLVALGQGVTPAQAQTSPSKENRIKAAFLFNFAAFVEWPANSLPAANAPIVIGVLGEDPFGSFLDDVVHGEKVNGRALEVRRFREVSEATNCQILFISDSESGKLTDILAALKGHSALTVGDADDFADRGGMIQFATKDKIHLRINLEAAKQAGLTVSSKLLRVAEIVKGGKP
ncbi:MAG TPA: YfiR family protein [Verrucomicrobiae bacterium]|jgi:hypothetical protein|nr:YfiR family protein [Verrucomicrobiae bacterium]